MRICRNIMATAVIAAISIGPAGCGGAPATGEQLTPVSGDAAKKSMVEGYLKTMVKPKGQRKARQ